MATQHLYLLVIFSIVSQSYQYVSDNKVDSNDESPFSDIAKEIMKEKNLENIGGMVNNFMQSDGAKQLLSNVLQNVATGENAGKLMEGLGSLLSSVNAESNDGANKESKKKQDDLNPADILSGLGSIVGALQGAAGGSKDKANPADLLQGFGSLLSASHSGNNDGEDNTAANVLQGLGSLLGAATNQNGGGAGILQGLGSLMAGNGGDGQAGISPEMIGNLVNMFASAQGESNEAPKKASKNASPKKASTKESSKKKTKSENRKTKSNKTKGDLDLSSFISIASSFLGSNSGKGGESNFLNYLPALMKVYNFFADSKNKNATPRQKQDDSFDLNSMLNLASSFLNQKSEGKSEGGSSFMDYLPMVLNTINAFVGEEAQDRAKSHSDHGWTIPPVMEKIHLYFDNFLHSDMGKGMLGYIGGDRAFKVFQDDNGNFSYSKFEELIENHSFRRHWIRQISEKLVEFFKLMADERTQKAYVMTGLEFGNSYFKSNGFPKDALVDLKNPVDSISKFVKFAAKKYFDVQISAREYVKPAVYYIKNILKMAQKSLVLGKEPTELTDTLTETINMEIIEPITRVNRAYRFAKSYPKCDRYVFCLINQHDPDTQDSLPALKKALYKFTSLIAGWFISGHSGTSYFELYADITQNTNCQHLHHSVCDGFHSEEIKVTTEYVHNEL